MKNETKTKTARVSARISPSVYNTLIEASEIAGSTLNQFLVQAALEKAQAIIEQDNKIRLRQQSAEHLFELIENPPKVNPKLAQTMKQYKQDLKC
ncbi:DUF1778 domain-containing protein [Desulfobacula sp.]|uniref:type II toxin-antitoxin system TacA family antitoxin n=1 Tax=Desulfobacula sp. TaxID=2593537 RepID=UPI002605A029|nr:DUF1778 domain-containing protein [Desulfobacula sp.]